MGTCKALKVIVDLEISSVTCPGVWLPNKGEVLVRIWLLERSSRTASVLPVFPLVYNERFTFEKVFTCQRLPELHNLLAHETVRAELQQLRMGRVASLASFECSLLTLLYPEVDRPDLQCSEEVSLCMQPLFHFPGVLPPKIEIVTKTIIQEVLRRISKKSCISKTIGTEIVDPPSTRSSKDVHKLAVQAHSRRIPSPREPRCHGNKRPPFVVRHVDSDIFKLGSHSAGNSSPRSSAGSSGDNYKCRHSSKSRRTVSECDCKLVHRPSGLAPIPLCKNDDLVDLTEQMSLYDGDCRHRKGTCTVCRLYRTYFGHSYPHHQHAERETNAVPTQRCECDKSSASREVQLCECYFDDDSSDPFKPLSLSEWCREKRCLRSKQSYDSHSSCHNESS